MYGQKAAATAHELAAIEAFALRTVKPGEVRVFQARIANNRIDRDRDRFHEDVLADFVASLPGKSVLLAHQWGPPGHGKVLDARLEQDADGTLWVIAHWYLPTTGNEKLINDLELGVASYMSIGFSVPRKVDVVDAAGDLAYSEFQRGPNGERAEAIEISLVHLGAQYDAAVTKSVVVQAGPAAARAIRRAMAVSKNAIWKGLGPSWQRHDDDE